jgi:two-component system sensor histidine kinase DesK
MSTIGLAADRLFGLNPRWARWLVVAVHVTFIVPASYEAGSEGPFLRWPWDWTAGGVTLTLGLALLALQLRLSLAFGTGQRLRSAPWLLLAIAILIYLPMVWLGWEWSWMQACLLASVPMVLRPRPALAVIAAVLVGSSVEEAYIGAGQVVGPGIFTGIFWVAYTVNSFCLPAAGMYGSARLVSLVEALRGARAELATAAVTEERRRIARDLHDLLGQSLSAISLKGDLAIRLFASDPIAARAEVESLTDLAREAVRSVRVISRDERVMSLREEADGAAALLAAAGVKTRLELDLSDLTPPLEALLAWAVREGVANTLRHSDARTCSITAQRRGRQVALEIVNDGVSGPAGEGSGLAGLAERAHMLGGSVSAGPITGGGFRLSVEVPKEAA